MEQMSLFDMEETGVEFDLTKRLHLPRSERSSARTAGGCYRRVQKNNLPDRSGAWSQYYAGDSVSIGGIF